MGAASVLGVEIFGEWGCIYREVAMVWCTHPTVMGARTCYVRVMTEFPYNNHSTHFNLLVG